jgi:signal transduction histidine kinase
MQETLGENIFLLIIMCTGGISLLVISFVLLFIRNQNKLLKNRQQIHDAEMAHQKELMNTIIQSQEMERKRIGEDLHDEVGGSLSSLRMLIRKLDNNVDDKQVIEDALNSYKQLIDKIIQDVRNISHNLSPPALALFGFTTALEELGDFINKSGQLSLSVINHAGEVTGQLPYLTALALFRILQELVSNTVKHADAKLIGISIFMDNGLLTIHYTDDGKGYDYDDINNKKGMGMQNIESRMNMLNATYTLKTAIGQGFSMSVYINPKQ